MLLFCLIYANVVNVTNNLQIDMSALTMDDQTPDNLFQNESSSIVNSQEIHVSTPEISVIEEETRPNAVPLPMVCIFCTCHNVV